MTHYPYPCEFIGTTKVYLDGAVEESQTIYLVHDVYEHPVEFWAIIYHAGNALGIPLPEKPDYYIDDMSIDIDDDDDNDNNSSGGGGVPVPV